MDILDIALLEQITEQAQQSPRLRMNYNLHNSLDAKAQKLFNALEPGTDLPIHRHPHSSETYLVVKGAIRVFRYSDDKELLETYQLEAGGKNFGVNILAGEWHTLEVLESGTVIFEVKDGPYTPLEDEHIMII